MTFRIGYTVLALLLVLWGFAPAVAQVSSATVVSNCSTAIPTYVSGGAPRPPTVDTNGNLCISNSGVRGTLTDRGAPLTNGGTAVTVMAANTSRKYLFCQNGSTLTREFPLGGGTLESVFISLIGTATTTGTGVIELVPGASFVMEGSYISTQALSAVATTSGHYIMCLEG